MNKKIGHIFIILMTYLSGIALLCVLVYGALPKKGDPNYKNAKQAVFVAKNQLEERHPSSEFNVLKAKAGSLRTIDNTLFELGKSDKWLITFLRYDPKNNPKYRIIDVTFHKGKVTSEGVFEADYNGSPQSMVSKARKNSFRLANWDTDVDELYNSKLFIAKERNYRRLKAVEIDFNRTKPTVILTFVRKMTSIEKKAFERENYFAMSLELTLSGEIGEITETAIKL